MSQVEDLYYPAGTTYSPFKNTHNHTQVLNFNWRLLCDQLFPREPYFQGNVIVYTLKAGIA